MVEIFVDFETYKEITERRTSEEITPGDIVRQALGLPPKKDTNNEKEIKNSENSQQYWLSDGVRFPVGTKLEHRFRDGHVVEAIIVEDGILFNNIIYNGFSPAAKAAAGCVVNGWKFWYIMYNNKLTQVNCLRGYNFINKSF